MNRVACIFFLVVSSGIFAQTGSYQQIGAYLDSLGAHKKVMGSFAIEQKGKSVYKKAIGFADAQANLKADFNTEYRVGSVTKIFTAVLIMQTMEENKISLNQKLADFYPEIANAEKISVKDLLQHRSGIHDLTRKEDFLQLYLQPQTKAQLLAKISQYKSDFLPGTKYEYSNSNYIILGAVLEKIFSKPYQEILNQKIVQSLKLQHTRVGGKIVSSKNQAKSYQWTGSYFAVPETDMSIPLGAGSMVSTPTDLNTFLRALAHGKLVSEKSFLQMTDFVDGYGLGLIPYKIEGETGFGHEGIIDGFHSAAFYFPKKDVSVSFITNQTTGVDPQILDFMTKSAFGKDFKMPSFAEVKVAESVLKSYEGLYKNQNFPLDINIFVRDGKLFGQATGQGAFPLSSISETVFEFSQAGIKMIFEPKNGTMKFSQGETQVLFKK